jgi:hypothetical protein
MMLEPGQGGIEERRSGSPPAIDDHGLQRLPQASL